MRFPSNFDYSGKKTLMKWAPDLFVMAVQPAMTIKENPPKVCIIGTLFGESSGHR